MPSAPRPTPATAPASSPRSRTPSCATSSTSTLPAAGSLRRRHRVPAGRRRARSARPSPRSSAIAAEEGLAVLGWRDVPVDAGAGRCDRAGVSCRASGSCSSPPRAGTSSGMALERMAFCLRKRAEHEAGVYFPSLSARTLVYKGMLTTGQLEPFFPDLSDRAVRHRAGARPLAVLDEHLPVLAAGAPVPARSPTTARSTPSRATATGCGPARRSSRSDVIPGDLARLFPICTAGRAATRRPSTRSSSCCTSAGRSLPHAVLMMIPEAWENHAEMDPARRAFYEFHSMFMEPWDGPAVVAFTDGTLIGAVLDRNGLRPGRYWVTDDGLVVLACEVGVLDIDPATVVRKGRLAAGPDVPRRHRRTAGSSTTRRSRPSSRGQHPYDEWLHARADPPRRPARARARRAHARPRSPAASRPSATPRRSCASSSRRWPAPAAEPIGSMGTDTPIAVLSERPRLLFDYFTQLFAQVTNPPLDAHPRGARHLARHARSAPSRNLLEATPAHCRQLVLPFPVIDNDELAKIVHINADGDLPGLRDGDGHGPLPRRRRRGRARRPARGDLRRGLGGDRARARGSSCCPTATPTPTSRRSRRCC